jgi:hypothetical protein
VVNDGRWKIKGSYVGKEAFNSYFGYPSSMPPAYAKARGTRKVSAKSRTARKKGTLARSKAGKGRKAARTRNRARGKTAGKAARKPLAVQSPSARTGG